MKDKIKELLIGDLNMNYLMTRNNNGLTDFDTFFDDMFGNWGVRNSTIPSVDVLEDKNAYYVEAELAGYKEEDVKIDVENHVLHLASEKKSEANNNKKYILRERGYVKFDRSFSLPENVDESKIEAKFEGGILTITLPKKPVVEPKRISIGIKH